MGEVSSPQKPSTTNQSLCNITQQHVALYPDVKGLLLLRTSVCISFTNRLYLFKEDEFPPLSFSFNVFFL